MASPSDVDDPEDAMRAMMGFSSFNSSQRKIDRQLDAEPVQPGPGHASGANAIPTSILSRMKPENLKSKNNKNNALDQNLAKRFKPSPSNTEEQSQTQNHSLNAVETSDTNLAPVGPLTSLPLPKHVPPAPGVPAYTSPTTGISFTSNELDLLARGAGPRNSKGDPIFFKPGFIIDDPWEKLRNSRREGDIRQ